MEKYTPLSIVQDYHPIVKRTRWRMQNIVSQHDLHTKVHIPKDKKEIIVARTIMRCLSRV